ncbi:MAG TPA: adenosyl-hopene transferase HpnH, partial [Dehalococcoidia bacterium]|nr:adenosyl-hopene transferase HpnH [Dehalococcoidia bacterium]
MLSVKLAWYLFKKKAKGRKYFPLTMILEPLEACNLTCTGCGRIREYEPILDRYLGVEDCLRAVAECDPPVVSIAGGEPLMHPQIGEIVAGIVRRKRFVYLCTNALLYRKAMKVIKPSSYFSFVVHLDGLRETHDIAVERNGVYDVAVKAIMELRRAGYRVCTNTTLFDGNHPEEYHQLFAMLNEMGVEGMMVAPGFRYKEVAHHNIFLQREEARSFLRRILEGCQAGIRFYNNPLHLDFLQGKREYECSQWATPTYTPAGWCKPCYLIADEHAPTFAELIETTDWRAYGFGRDPRCDTCMMHCGYEGSAIAEAMEKPSALLELAWRSLRPDAGGGKGKKERP